MNELKYGAYMNKIFVTVLLIISLVRADNIGYCVYLESSKYWKNDYVLLNFNLLGVQRLSYGMDIHDYQQRVTFIGEYAPTKYQSNFYSLGINWLDISKNSSGNRFYREICIGPQLLAKYCKDDIEALYLSPSLVISANNYLNRLGFVFTGDIGYNFLVSQNGSKTDQNLRMQSDLSVRLGVGVLFNLSTRKKADDFE